MKKLFSILFISCFPFLLAGCSIPHVHLHSSAVANHTDLSVAFLSQVFGTVGTVLHGTSGQMLGRLFYTLNIGVLFVAGVWLSYTTFTIALKSAHEGSFMGANRNVALIFLKIALGFALLMPNPTTGYSVFQDVVMQVVVKGVVLADQTWSYGLKYLNQGGAVWRRPAGAGFGNLSPYSAKMNNSIQTVFADEVCMVASNLQNKLNSNSNSNSTNNIYVSRSPVRQYHIVRIPGYGFAFPGIGNPVKVTNPNAAKCGAVAWYKPGSANEYSYSHGALRQMVYDLKPIAKEYLYNSGSSLATSASSSYVNTSANLQQDVSEAFFGAMVNYINSIMPVVTAQSAQAKQSARNFLMCTGNGKCAQSEGWMMAGRYYWDLSRINTKVETATDISSYAPIPKTYKVSAGEVKSAADGAVKNSKKTYMPRAVQKLKNYFESSNKGDSERRPIPSFSISSNAGTATLEVLMAPINSTFSKILAMFNNGGMGVDPIYFLHRIGMLCLSSAGTIWLSMAGLIAGMSLLTVVCNATLNMNNLLSNVTNWIKPFFMTNALVMLGAGFMLGIYVPLYPYMLFTFGVIGWIIAVIEAMVAAPLVCLGLTHPENHDFLGAAQQALMLLLGIFIRPVLMVIGLFGGMILSYVSFRIVIYTFSGFIGDLFYTKAPLVGGGNANILAFAQTAYANMQAAPSINGLGGDVGALLIIPIMLVIFCAIVYVVTNQCFSLIYILPDNTLRWIGMSPMQSMGAQMAQQVQGALGGMNQGGRALSDQINATKEKQNGPLKGKSDLDVNTNNDSKNDDKSSASNTNNSSLGGA